ncbi:MAG: hypothetical protein J5J06_00625 [Phycisphaerae bacterium]|nr:hypothetical protein [Phycisphaerae bacterium]
MLGLLCTLMAPLAAIPPDALSVSARMDAPSLEVGQTYTIQLDAEFAKGVSAADAGIPAPILQIDVPTSAELAGKVLATQDELRKNEFLQAPYERLLKELPARVEFKLTREPASNEHFALNVIAYLADDEGNSRFVRKRLTLPLAGSGEATPADPTTSTWGRGDTLQIGDRVEPFTLPRADGSKLSLDGYLGKKNIIVTTYRAHW